MDRKEYKQFYFEDFMFDLASLQAKFYYSFDKEVFFEEIIDFDDPGFDIRGDIDFEVLENILFHLHLALWISYYKLYPTSNLFVLSGKIDDFQKDFWKKFYINGLAEFFYTNNISPKDMCNFQSQSEKVFEKKEFRVSWKALVPVGGGKDSIVSITLLQEQDIDFDVYVFGKTDTLKDASAQISGKKMMLTQRTLSSKLFEMNHMGYYNGHVPITWIIAFALQAVAYLFDYKYLILSNEKSANYNNTIWEWIEVNHQYSKSLAFEKDFAEYVEKYISWEVKYFSLLRGMYEQKISYIFTQKSQKYFEHFSSCNKNFKILQKSTSLEGKHRPWCCECPKCAFVFTLLSAYLEQTELTKIFWENLYKNEKLLWVFEELLGISWIKPFECVWTNEEVVYSLSRALEMCNQDSLPVILNMYQQKVGQNISQKEIVNLENKLLKLYSQDIIPEELKEKIFENEIKHEDSH